jgi:hypothetical protein
MASLCIGVAGEGGKGDGVFRGQVWSSKESRHALFHSTFLVPSLSYFVWLRYDGPFLCRRRRWVLINRAEGKVKYDEACCGILQTEETISYSFIGISRCPLSWFTSSVSHSSFEKEGDRCVECV